MPVKTQMQMNLFDFTCQNTKLKSIFWILCDQIDLVKIQIQKNLKENSLVSLIKSHYKSIFFLHSIILEFGCIFKYKFCKILCSEIYMTEIQEKCTPTYYLY